MVWLIDWLIDWVIALIIRDTIFSRQISVIIVNRIFRVDFCRQCQILVMALRKLGFSCAGLHSMMQQKDRLSALARFKSHNVRVLISTDVGSRGLDIPKVDLVVNHNVPSVSKDYIHRVGRTARAKKKGLAITLVTQFDVRLIHAIEDMIGTKLEEYPFDESLIQASLNEVELATREAGITLDEQDFDERRLNNRRKDAMLRQWQQEEAEEVKWSFFPLWSPFLVSSKAQIPMESSTFQIQYNWESS